MEISINMGLEILLILIVLGVTRSTNMGRSVKALLIIGYFGALILVWSITWRIPYRPNALFIDLTSLGLPFAFWVFCLFIAKKLTMRW